MNGYIIRTGDGQDLKEQMKSQMRQQYRNGNGGGNQGNNRVVGREYEHGFRDGYREGYEQAMRDDQDYELNRHIAFSNGDQRGDMSPGGKYSM